MRRCVASSERVYPTCKIDPPDPVLGLADSLTNALSVLLIARRPVSQCRGAVASEISRIDSLQPALLQCSAHRLCVALVGVGVRDAMVYQHAVVCKEAANLRKVRWEVVPSHVLKHSNIRDPLKGPADIAIVFEPDLDPVAQASRSNPFGCELVLILRERYAHASRSVGCGSTHD